MSEERLEPSPRQRLIKCKMTLEAAIHAMVSEFEADTGLKVRELKVIELLVVSYDSPQTTRIEVVAELPTPGPFQSRALKS